MSSVEQYGTKQKAANILISIHWDSRILKTYKEKGLLQTFLLS